MTNITTLVSVDSNGMQGNGRPSYHPSISADGRYVVFGSMANNMVSGDTNSAEDIFMHDTVTGITTRISVDSSGAQSNGHSGYPSISADGRYISFESSASNLVNGDTNNTPDIFVRDTVLKTTTRASINSSGAQMNINMVILWPSLSADGHHVVFQSKADNLVSGDTKWIYRCLYA
ncbi:hypothetical protein [Candidatus Villigracilis affinis]|uniref:TolB family protein n=1 Tax=Candidatus Villigracilis affinis TaxID=3140682 RepID=UPI0031E54100